MADLTVEVKIKNSTKDGAEQAKRAVRGVADEAENAATKTRSLANVDFAQIKENLNRIGDKIKSVGESIAGLGQKMTLALTVPILGLAALIGSLGVGYESSLNIFQAVTKATADEMKAASKVAKDLGADIDLPATSAKDAALAMAELGKAGLTAKESMDATRATLLLAAAGQLEEAKAAEITANALNSFSLKAADAARVADLLAAASNASSAEVTDVAESFQQASATFAAAKVPIEDLTTAIAIMANAGIKGSDAGTSLKTFLSSIQAPSTKGADALQNLGIKVFDLQGKMKPLPELIGQFEKSLAGLTDEKKVQAIQDIFGSDASRAAQILFRDGEAGFNKIKEAVTQTGAAADLAKAKTKGLGGAWEALKSQAETVGITIFEALKGPAEQGVRFLAENLGKVSDYLANLAETNPELIQLGAVFLGIVAAVGPLLVIFGTLIGFLGTVVSGVGTLIGVLAPLGAFIVSFVGLIGEAGLVASFSALASVLTGTVTAAISPVLAGLASLIPVILAVAAVIGVMIGIGAALFAAWQTNFGGIRELVATVAVAIQNAWTKSVEAIRQLTADVTAQISQFWTENGADIMRAVDTASANIKKTWESVVAFWSENGETIKAYTAAAWGQVRTIVTSAVSIIANVIKLIAAVINGDWRKAFEAAKAICDTALAAIVSIVKNGISGLISAVKLLFLGIFSLHDWVVSQAISLGKNLVLGIINGIGSLASAVYEKGKSLISGLLGSMRSTAEVQSPSKKTKEIGEFIGEGLAIGMENKVDRVRSVAKRVAAEAIKAMREAMKEFQKLAGASPETVSTIQTTDRIKEATSSQSEIIKLRGQLGLNQSLPLPTNVAGVESEISYLRQRNIEAEKYNKTLDDLRNSYNALQDAAAKANEEFTKKIEAIQQNGDSEILKLREEVSLTGVIDESERRRIQNVFEILRLREQMANDGFGQQQIDEAAETLRLEQARVWEWQRILEIRKQVAQASDLEKDLTGRLSELQNGNRELSEYEKTLQKINTVLKDISPQQKENLLILAQQIDAQKAYNAAYSKTYDFIRGTFETLADSGKSIKEKLGSIFGGILNSFKKMLLDMASAWLTSKLLKIFGIGGSQSGGSQSGGGLGNIFGSIFGGNAGGGIFNLAGSSSSGGSSASGSPAGGGIFDIFKNLFGGGGRQTEGAGPSGGAGGGKALGIASAIGVGANIIGGLIGGRVGGFLSNIGSGVAIGAQIGSIIPGIGTVVGAVVGGAIGFLKSLFGGDPKKKTDKKENLPKLQEGFKEAFEQLRQLSADKNAFYNDPDGTIQKAQELRAQIAVGFGVKFQSKKYRNIAQQQITQKLAEADLIIKEMESTRNQVSSARIVDEQLNANFATGVYMDKAFLKQYSQFKRRNGILAGEFTGRDILPSYLAAGEMVLNPSQIGNVIQNAGGEDVFKRAGIPGYATGTFVGGNNQQTVAASSVSSPSRGEKQPILVKIYQTNSGLVESDILDVVVEGLQDDYELQTEVVKSYDKTKSRTR